MTSWRVRSRAFIPSGKPVSPQSVKTPRLLSLRLAVIQAQAPSRSTNMRKNLRAACSQCIVPSSFVLIVLAKLTSSPKRSAHSLQERHLGSAQVWKRLWARKFFRVCGLGRKCLYMWQSRCLLLPLPTRDHNIESWTIEYKFLLWINRYDS
jgi:hypothetical protein